MAVAAGQLASLTLVLGGPHWSINSNTLIRVDRLRDLDSPKQFVNDAVIVAQMTDSAGADVGGQMTFSYVTGSDGRYHGTVASTLALTLGAQYTLTVTILAGGLASVKKITRVAKHDTRAA